MYFSELPNHIKDAIIKLTNDEQFQHRFATDKILDDIEGLKINRAEQFQMILQIYEQDLTFNDKKYPPMTLAIWSFLWVIDSPFVKGKRPEPIDLDIVFYLLYNGVEDFDVNKVINQSQGFCKNKLGLQQETALLLISNIINIAFKPLKMFPQQTGNTDHLFFDADWIANVVTKVYSVTGYSPKYVMNNLSITACCYYFAQYCRMQGALNIFRRTDEEILILQMERSVDLICDRLIELNVFPTEERNKWRQIMLTPPDKCK